VFLMRKSTLYKQAVCLFMVLFSLTAKGQQVTGPVFPFQVREWVYLGGHPLNYLVYGSTTSLSREGGIISVWILRTTFGYQKPGLIPGISGLSSKSLENIDCYKNQIRHESLIIYSEIMGGGKPQQLSASPIQWQKIVPDTDASGLHAFFCNRDGNWWK
jgi:hypothetical protein